MTGLLANAVLASLFIFALAMGLALIRLFALAKFLLRGEVIE